MRRREFLQRLGACALLPKLAWAMPIQPALQVESAPIARITSFEDTPIFNLIACGGAGIAMTRGIDKGYYGISKIIAIDTSIRSLASATHADHCILIEADGKKPSSADEAWFAAENYIGEIRHLIDGHLAIIVTGLGGRTGSVIASQVALAARFNRMMNIAFSTLPMHWESDLTHELALGGYGLLHEYADNVLLYSHLVAMEAFGKDEMFHEVIAYSKIALREYLWNTVGCLKEPGIPGIDFEDIRTVLSNDLAPQVQTLAKPSSAIGWGRASGHGAAANAADIALHHPLLQSASPAETLGISVSIRGSSRPKMKDLSTVVGKVKETFGENSYLIYSADHDEQLKEDIGVSIVVNRIATKGWHTAKFSADWWQNL